MISYSLKSFSERRSANLIERKYGDISYRGSITDKINLFICKITFKGNLMDLLLIP